MKFNFFRSSLFLAAVLLPLGAQAQGVIGGASEGAAQGENKAGPIGAVLGGIVGGVVGGIDGLIGIDQRPRFHEYVIAQHRTSYRYDRELRVGVVLPPSGLDYYDIPAEYGRNRYRYGVINGHTVLVDPHTNTIVQIID